MSDLQPAQRAFLLTLLFVGVAFCQPMHVFPLVNFIEELLVLLGVLLAAGFLFWGQTQLRISLWCGMWLAFGGLLVLSSWLHPAPFVSYQLLAGVFWLAGFLALLISDQLDWAVEGQRLSGWLAYALLIAALICAVGGFIRFYGVFGGFWNAYMPEPNSGRMTGLVGHSNFFAFISFFGLLAAGWLFNARRLSGGLCLVPVVLLVGAMIATGGRAVLLAWVAVVLVLWVRHRAANATRWLLFMAGAFVFYWLFKPLFFAFDHWLYALVTQLGWVNGVGLVSSDVAERGAVSIQRLDEWRVTFALICEYFWTGVGVGNYAVSSYQQHLAWGMPSPDGIFVHSHNSPMQLVVELGVLGLIWLVVLLVLAGRAFWSASADGGRLLPLLILLVLQIYGLLEFPLWMMHFLVLHMVLLGALGGASLNVKLRLGKLFAGLILLAGLMVSLVYVPLVERFVWSYRQYFLHADVSPSEYKFVDSVIRDPLLEPFGYLLYFANFDLSAGTLERERAVLERFRGYLPYSQVLVRLAMVYMIQGDEPAAQKVLDDMRVFYGSRYDWLVAEQAAVNKRLFPDIFFERLLEKTEEVKE